MKKLSLILLTVALFCVTDFVSAQKVTGYTIKSKFTAEGTTDANFLSQLPSEVTELVLGNRSKQVMQIQEGVGIITLMNGDNKEYYQIYDIAGFGKGYVKMNEEKLKERRDKAKYDFNYTGEKKTIANYECEKVEVKVTDLETDDEETMVVYVSKDLNPTDAMNFVTFPGLVGYVLRAETHTEYEGDNVTLIQEVYEVTPNKKIKSVDFLLPSDAVDIMESPQWKSMLGMGGDDEEEED